MPNTTLRQRRVLAATALSYVVVILDTSIVNVALERIADEFGTGITGLQWVVNAYVLSFASLLLTGGALGDRLGARDVYLAGLAIFAVASALCGAAIDLPMLTAARILQGIGAAMLVPCSLSLINQAFPDPIRRAAAIGLWAGFGGVAMAAGPVVGGVLIHLLGWRAIFLVNVPIGVFGLLLTVRVRREAGSTPGRHLDLVGQGAAIVALGLLVAVLIEGPVLGWGSPIIVFGAAADLAVWGVFLMLETRQAQPMLPLVFFKDRVFSSSALASMVSASTFYGLIFVMSLYLQHIRGFSPLQTGLAFLPLTGLVTAGSFLSGLLVRAYGPRRSLCIAFGIYATGFLGLIAAITNHATWLSAPAMMLIGFAAGFITPAVTAAMMGTVDKGRAGIAAGVLNAARQTGAALGVAIFGAVVSTQEGLVIGLQAALWGAVAVSLLAAGICWSAPKTQIQAA